jgi:hypothetical protein
MSSWPGIKLGAQTVVNFPISAGDHFFAMTRVQKVLEAAAVSSAAGIKRNISFL